MTVHVDDSVNHLKSPLLSEAGFAHAFFTRCGGSSQPPWASLNFARNTGDRAEHVSENLSVAARELGVSKEQLYFLSQVHGIATTLVDGSEDRDEVVRREGDAILSWSAGVACGVRSADCVPVLVAHPRSGAVLAIHAGWRGVELGIVGAAIAELRARRAGSDRLIASVGPHIEACCFEVGEDVASRLSMVPGARDVVDRTRRRNPHVDLRKIVDAQLSLASVAVEDRDHVRGCTFCDAARFFSFRRDGQVSGRLLSAIVARAEL